MKKTLRKGEKIIYSFTFSLRWSLMTPRVSGTGHRVQRQSTIFRSDWIKLSCSSVPAKYFHKTVKWHLTVVSSYKASHLPRTDKSINFTVRLELWPWLFVNSCGLGHLTSWNPRLWNKSNISFSQVAELSSVQSLRRVWLCDPMDCSRPGFPVHHQLPELALTHVHRVADAIQPSHPLSFCSPPAFNLSHHQGLFQWVSSLHQVAKVLELQH